MKKFIIVNFLFASSNYSHSQIQQPSLSVGFATYDFQTISNINSSGLRSALKNNLIFNTKKMQPAIFLEYTEGFTKRIDGTINIVGSTFQANIASNSAQTKSSVLFETSIIGKIKLLQNTRRLIPFVQSGLSGSTMRGEYFLNLPLGAGVQANLMSDIFITINSQYRWRVSNNGTSHMFAAIGIGGVIGRKKNKTIVNQVLSKLRTETIVLDTDADGIIDQLDQCPLVKGIAVFEGCPDSDNDGIVDNIDKCPQLAGILRYDGCPIPDTDSDGITDESDSCVSIPGEISNHGCPLATKNNDENPHLPGALQNDSISIRVTKLAEQIEFNTGSAELKAESKLHLRKIIGLLDTRDIETIFIEAHTDNIGTGSDNQKLSEYRLRAVQQYFTNARFSPISLQIRAFGESKPKTTNLTDAGRQKNRRVEIMVKFKQ